MALLFVEVDVMNDFLLHHVRGHYPPLRFRQPWRGFYYAWPRDVLQMNERAYSVRLWAHSFAGDKGLVDLAPALMATWLHQKGEVLLNKGSSGRTRTCNTLINSQVLYH